MKTLVLDIWKNAKVFDILNGKNVIFFSPKLLIHFRTKLNEKKLFFFLALSIESEGTKASVEWLGETHWILCGLESRVVYLMDYESGLYN